ncbi:hypothetical protein PAPYR_10066 [Paratrimastix pyriformis]|uniref:Uncharacterized protein n=1 Tax=Paratrimastix pyriformis TaxID=342808 RepID=A0ABQ8U6S1_9EUKA|nr:hypothetical protein PAPYR_10066 [Paratrimastix pyriformis]
MSGGKPTTSMLRHSIATSIPTAVPPPFIRSRSSSPIVRPDLGASVQVPAAPSSPIASYGLVPHTRPSFLLRQSASPAGSRGSRANSPQSQISTTPGTLPPIEPQGSPLGCRAPPTPASTPAPPSDSLPHIGPAATEAIITGATNPVPPTHRTTPPPAMLQLASNRDEDDDDDAVDGPEGSPGGPGGEPRPAGRRWDGPTVTVYDSTAPVAGVPSVSRADVTSRRPLSSPESLLTPTGAAPLHTSRSRAALLFPAPTQRSGCWGTPALLPLSPLTAGGAAGGELGPRIGSRHLHPRPPRRLHTHHLLTPTAICDASPRLAHGALRPSRLAHGPVLLGVDLIPASRPPGAVPDSTRPHTAPTIAIGAAANAGPQARVPGAGAGDASSGVTGSSEAGDFVLAAAQVIASGPHVGRHRGAGQGSLGEEDPFPRPRDFQQSVYAASDDGSTEGHGSEEHTHSSTSLCSTEAEGSPPTPASNNAPRFALGPEANSGSGRSLEPLSGRLGPRMGIHEQTIPAQSPATPQASHLPASDSGNTARAQLCHVPGCLEMPQEAVLRLPTGALTPSLLSIRAPSAPPTTRSELNSLDMSLAEGSDVASELPTPHSVVAERGKRRHSIATGQTMGLIGALRPGSAASHGQGPPTSRSSLGEQYMIAAQQQQQQQQQMSKGRSALDLGLLREDEAAADAGIPAEGQQQQQGGEDEMGKENEAVGEWPGEQMLLTARSSGADSDSGAPEVDWDDWGKATPSPGHDARWSDPLAEHLPTLPRRPMVIFRKQAQEAAAKRSRQRSRLSELAMAAVLLQRWWRSVRIRRRYCRWRTGVRRQRKQINGTCFDAWRRWAVHQVRARDKADYLKDVLETYYRLRALRAWRRYVDCRRTRRLIVRTAQGHHRYRAMMAVWQAWLGYARPKAKLGRIFNGSRCGLLRVRAQCRGPFVGVRGLGVVMMLGCMEMPPAGAWYPAPCGSWCPTLSAPLPAVLSGAMRMGMGRTWVLPDGVDW